MRKWLIVSVMLAAIGVASFATPANVAYDIVNMVPAAAASATPQNIFRSENGIIFAYGTTVPSDAATGYAPGCIFFDVDASTRGTQVFQNEGTKASANFDSLSNPVVGDLALTTGSILVGASSVASELVAKTSGQILVGSGTTLASVAVSGDATLASTGALTIATGAVEDSMIEGLAAGQIILGVDGTAANNLKAVLSGDVTMDATGAVTIAPPAAGTVTWSSKMDFSGVTPATETTGSIMTTGSTWLNHTQAGACALKFLCASTATSGDYATLRIRGRADAVSSGGIDTINSSASTTIADYHNLCAVYAAGQPMAINTTDATSIVCGLHSVIDATGTSSGRRWVEWIDTHAETKADASDYMMRISHNGTVANDGAITVYTGGRLPVLFNFEDAAGFLTDTSISAVTQSGAIAVTTPAGTKYIVLYDHP